MPTVAVVQLRPEPADPAGNRTRSVEWIDRAADAGADIVILPELCCTGYADLLRDPGRVRDVAEAIPGGPSVEAWTRACERCGIHVVAGLVERTPRGLYNSAVVVGPAGVVGVYRKAHLFDAEKEVFLPGDTGFPVFDLPSVRLGILICYDLRFVEAPRILALQGAELLAVPATWTDRNKTEPWDARGWCMYDYLALAHAYANRMFVAAADRVGVEAGVRYLGASVVVDPGGRVLAGPAPTDQEMMLVVPVTPAAARDKGLGRNDLWADRRTDLYHSRLGYLRPGPPSSTGTSGVVGDMS